MTLARIITRSHHYSQQLALDLLARGYAVEIVSPDAIPNTPADLELRVEAGSGDTQGQVTEVREGRPARTMEYLQRLRPLMADLLRKWPSRETSSDAGQSAFNFNAEHEYSDDMELPSSSYPAPSKPPRIEPKPELDSARLISRREHISGPSFSITGEQLGWEEVEEVQGGNSEVWFWRAAVGFAGVALLILAFGMALRRNPAPHAPPSAEVAQNTAVNTPSSPAKPTVLPPTATLSPVRAKPVATTGAVTDSSRPKPTPVVRRVKTAQFQEVENGDITVTHFNTKASAPAKPATARQESGIKHYSDLN